jgi:hypothetical protein
VEFRFRKLDDLPLDVIGQSRRSVSDEKVDRDLRVVTEEVAGGSLL